MKVTPREMAASLRVLTREALRVKRPASLHVIVTRADIHRLFPDGRLRHKLPLVEHVNGKPVDRSRVRERWTVALDGAPHRR